MPEDILPADLECERVVLHCALEGGEATEGLLPRLTSDHFVLERHRRILEAARAVYDRDGIVDRIILARYLYESGNLDSIGGLSYLTELQEGLPRILNPESYLGILEKKRGLRHILRTAEGIKFRAMHGADDPAKLVADLQAGLEAIPTSSGGSLKSAGDIIAEVGGLDALFAEASTAGVRVMFPPLARLVPFFRPGQVITLGGGTGGGKSSLARQLAIDTARQGLGVAVFSMEMSGAEVIRAMACSMAGISGRQFQHGKASETDRRALARAVADLEESGIYLCDNSALTVDAMRGEVKAMQKQRNIGLIVLDYLQLIPGGARGQNRTEAVDSISRSIKRMAMALRVPVLSLAQWSNKGSEAASEGQEPGLHHIRESGAIAQDSDVVLFVVAKRPDTGNMANPIKPFRLAVKKQRGGPVGAVEIVFDSRVTMFLEKAA
jgi:replicative DNA helicase